MARFELRADETDLEFLGVVLAVSAYTIAFAPNDWISVQQDRLHEVLSRCILGLEGVIRDMLAVCVWLRVSSSESGALLLAIVLYHRMA